MAIVFLVLASTVLVVLGFVGGVEKGEQTATVVSAEGTWKWKDPNPVTHIVAKLADGSEVSITSPHLPPPKEGQRIVLSVRKSLFGWRSYTWQPGKTAGP